MDENKSPVRNLLGGGKWREPNLGLVVLFAAVAISGSLGFFALKQGPRPTEPTKIAHVAEPLHLEPETSNIVTVAGRSLDIGDGGLAINAFLANPTDVSVLSSGKLYIAEFGTNRIRMVNQTDATITINAPSCSHDQFTACKGTNDTTSCGTGNTCSGTTRNIRPRNITTVAGTGASGLGGDGGQATAALINNPRGIAVDSLGNLYISEFSGHRIRKVDNTTGNITTVAGGCSTVVPTPAGFTACTIGGTGIGDDGPATAALINNPVGITFDSSGNLYISDGGNQRIRKVDNTTGIITTVPGGTALNDPRGIAVDSLGNLYISEFSGHRIRKVGTNGIIKTVAGTGDSGYNGDNIQATAAKLTNPEGVAFDSLGNLYISDGGNQRIRKVDNTTGIITTVAGTGFIGDSGDGGQATAALINNPVNIAIDSLGNLYIADAGNNRIRKVDTNGIITNVAGRIGGLLGDNGPATEALFFGPTLSMIPDSGNLYIADAGHHRIRKVGTDGIITTVAGTGNPGYNGDNIQATAANITVPFSGVSFDSLGNFYFSEFFGHRIRKVGTDGIITTVAGTGNPGYNGDNIQATLADINFPDSVAVDSQGNLYIAEFDGNRIRKVDKTTGIITTVAGTGDFGFSGDGGPATAAKFVIPLGIAVDSPGNLYIAEAVSRIRKVDKTTGIITTVAGTTEGDFAGDGGPATAAKLNLPFAVAVDSSGNLYISDSGNGRIRRLNVNTPVVAVNPDTPNIQSAQDKWVTLTIQFPEGRLVPSEVNLNSIMLQAIDPKNGAVRSRGNNVLRIGRALQAPGGFMDSNGDDKLDQIIVKFDRVTVADWATDTSLLVLRVEGQFNPPPGSRIGTFFSADTRNPNITPSSESPAPAAAACGSNLVFCCMPGFAKAHPKFCPAL